MCAVSERRRYVYAYLQPHLHDASDWSLERLSTVPGAHVTRLSGQHLGGHQRASSECYYKKYGTVKMRK